MMAQRELTKERMEERVSRLVDRWIDGRVPKNPATGTQGIRTITVDDHDVRELARQIVNHDFTKDEER